MKNGVLFIPDIMQYFRFPIPEAVSKNTKKKRYLNLFSQQNQWEGGTGLGLSIVYGIARNLEGTIILDSEKEKGTTVKVYFPLQEVEQAKKAIFSEKLKSLRILLAEDEKEVARTIKKLLETQEHKVVTVQDGNEALEIFRSFKEDFDVAMLDYMMPRVNGFQTYKNLKKINPDIPVIFITEYADIKKIKEEVENPGILQKPFTRDELISTIKSVLLK